MRRLALLTTILVALSAPGHAQDSATVQRLADQFADAFNKNAAAGIGEMYLEDAILVPPQADMRMGRKDIQAFWTQQAKQAEGLGIAVLDVRPLGPDAARAVVRGEMTTKGDKPRHLTGRNVVVLQKVGPDWKLAAHIWNFGADVRQAARDDRDDDDREGRRDADRFRERGGSGDRDRDVFRDRDREFFRGREGGAYRRDFDRDGGEFRRHSGRDGDEFRRHSGRDWREWDEFRPRYHDRFERRRFEREFEE